MPLSQPKLKDSLRIILDKDYLGFSGFPTTSAEVGLAWGEALNKYFEDIAVPAGITGERLAAAKSAFAVIFVPTFAAPTALALFSTAMTAYAATLVAVPAPIPGALPPPAPLTLNPLPNTTSAEVAANTIATAVDVWARTGTLTLPPAAPVPWS
jgi:hypothetical protein